MTRSNGKIEVKSADSDSASAAAETLAEDRKEAGAAAGASVISISQPGLQPGAESELEKLRAERDSLVDRLARLQAEFENARKRSVREQQDFREYALTGSVQALLPVLDSFERALGAAHPDAAEFRNGVELIYRQFADALQKLGLRVLEAKGQAFDPRLHEAIEMVDTAEVPDQQVVDELQRGYMLKDRLLRPAMVRVARNMQK